MDKKIKIYGERNTGTNYLKELIDLNFDVTILSGTVSPQVNRFIRRMPNEEIFRDLYFTLTQRYNLGWKHRTLKASSAFIRKVNRLENVFFIAMVKNPYSWLLSMYKKPYHTYGEMELSFNEFLLNPWKSVNRENSTSVFKNPMAIWNEKNNSYLEIKKHFRLSYLMKYEDLLTNLDNELEKMGTCLGLEMKHERILNYKKSTKESQKNNDFYKDYYGNEKWKDELNPRDIDIINKNIDTDLMNHFGYNVL